MMRGSFKDLFAIDAMDDESLVESARQLLREDGYLKAVLSELDRRLIGHRLTWNSARLVEGEDGEMLINKYGRFRLLIEKKESQEEG